LPSWRTTRIAFFAPSILTALGSPSLKSVVLPTTPRIKSDLADFDRESKKNAAPMTMAPAAAAATMYKFCPVRSKNGIENLKQPQKMWMESALQNPMLPHDDAFISSARRIGAARVR